MATYRASRRSTVAYRLNPRCHHITRRGEHVQTATLQGAFGWCDFVMDAGLQIGDVMHAGSRGSRTPLRRVLRDGASAVVTLSGDESHVFAIDVERSYEVPSRRHHPKVLAGDGAGARGRAFDLRIATWDAQVIARAIVVNAPSPEDEMDDLLREGAVSGPAGTSTDVMRGLFSCIAT